VASDGLPEVVGVEEVMRRYGLRDRRAARRLMDEAGAFIVGGRLVIRRADLLAHEEALRAARRAPVEATRRPAGSTPARRRGKGTPPPSAPLRPGWWRTDPGDRDAA
jgi:hypothetical protein